VKGFGKAVRDKLDEASVDFFGTERATMMYGTAQSTVKT
jgi:hypothetical protein